MADLRTGATLLSSSGQCQTAISVVYGRAFAAPLVVITVDQVNSLPVVTGPNKGREMTNKNIGAMGTQCQRNVRNCRQFICASSPDLLQFAWQFETMVLQWSSMV